MSGLSSWLALAVGGALGALLRATVYRAMERWSPTGTRGLLNRLGIPRATLVVNVLGALVLGISLGWLPSSPVAAEPNGLRLFWTSGVCGSLTTFSTFCAEAVGLARQGARLRLAGYLVANAAFSVAALRLGLELAR